MKILKLFWINENISPLHFLQNILGTFPLHTKFNTNFYFFFSYKPCASIVVSVQRFHYFLILDLYLNSENSLILLFQLLFPNLLDWAIRLVNLSDVILSTHHFLYFMTNWCLFQSLKFRFISLCLFWSCQFLITR